jgi:hypothetical protein
MGLPAAGVPMRACPPPIGGFKDVPNRALKSVGLLPRGGPPAGSVILARTAHQLIRNPDRTKTARKQDIRKRVSQDDDRDSENAGSQVNQKLSRYKLTEQ